MRARINQLRIESVSEGFGTTRFEPMHSLSLAPCESEIKRNLSEGLRTETAKSEMILAEFSD